MLNLFIFNGIAIILYVLELKMTTIQNLFQTLKICLIPRGSSPLGLPSLLYRRDRQDIILTFEILKNDQHPLRNIFILYKTNKLRGHSKKIVKTEHYSCNARQHFYSQRVIKNWNSLPEHIVSAPDLNSFKTLINSYNWHDFKFEFI